MAEVDGKVVMKSPDGRLYRVPPETAEKMARDLSWSNASDDETAKRVAEREQYAKYGSTGQQALAAGEQAVRTATFGLLPGSGAPEDIAGREKVLRTESPVISAVSQGLGALAPALATGGLAGGVAGAAGLGARGAAIAGAAGEGLAGAVAEEVEQARYETRDVSAGNVFLFGLGGEIVGRALPKGLALGSGKVKRALTAVDEVAGEGVPSAIAGAEAKSVASQAKFARDLPKGSTERAEALRRTAGEQYERMATEGAEDMDYLMEKASAMGDTSSSKAVKERLQETIADESPAQVEWFTGTNERLSQTKAALRKPMRETPTPTRDEFLSTMVDKEAKERAAEEIREATIERLEEYGVKVTDDAPTSPVKAAPVSLAGKTLSDLGVPLDKASERAASLSGLRSSEEFARTGRVPKDVDKAAHNNGVQLQVDPDTGSLQMIDGRHRFTVAQEKNLPTVWGTLREAGSGKVIYRGDIPLRKTRPRSPRSSLEGGEQWKVVEEEIVLERLKKMGWKPEKSPALADIQGLGGFANRLETIVDTTLRQMDQKTANFDRFLVARDAKKQLQHLSKEMSLVDAPHDRVFHDQLRQVVDETQHHLRGGLKDKSLFGAAAEIEDDINASWHDKILPGLGVTDQDLARRVGVDYRTGRIKFEFDPAKDRAFLKGDRVDRAITQRKLESVLDGLEELAAAHERHGTWSPDDIAEVRLRVARKRESLSLADEIQVAKHAEVDAPKGPKSKEGSGIGSEVLEFGLEKLVGTAIPFAGQAIKWGKRLIGIDQAARGATKQTARNLAGVGAGHAQRALSAVGDYGAAPAMTALARFTGDYAGPEESFEAKRKLLDEEQLSPDVLYEVLGQTLGDMPRVNPELFQAVAARTAGKVRYLRDNLPAGISATLLYPNGTPPSRSALREWATMWNTVMNPETVLEDITAGTATPLQMKTLRESDPDVYEQLRSDVIEQVGTHFKDVPTSTKVQLDLLFQADGLAGPLFSSTAARYIGDAFKQQEKRGPKQTGTPASKAPGSGSAAPSGLRSIQSSVTNAGGTT